MRRRAWLVWGGAALAAVLAYFTVLDDPWESIVYDTLAFAAAAAVLIGVRVHRPAARRGWLLLSAGIAAWAVGDSIWTLTDMFAGTVSFPSVADAAYLAGYLLMGAGIAVLVRSRGITRGTVRDAVTLGLAMGTIGIVPVLGPLADGSSSLVAEAVAVAYPVMTWVILVAAVSLGMSGGFRRPAERLLVGALTASLIADVLYAHLSLSGSYTSGSPVDAGWLLFYLGIGAAALHPSMADVGSPKQQTEQLTLGRLGVLSAALLASVVAEAMDIETNQLLLGLSAAVVALVIWRIWDLVSGLDRAALHDGLTGLPNRALLNDRIELALASARRRDGILALLFCDIDDFKRVNDSLGHGVGDALLRGVAARLSTVLRTTDTVARLGGDEFVILIGDAKDEAEVEAAADRVRTSLEAPVVLPDGSEFFVTMSVGVRVVKAEWNVGIDELLRDADAAMYVAKDRGRNRAALFHPLLHENALRRLQLATDLRRALIDGDIQVHYQPEVELEGGAFFGFEALARWRHPVHGFIPPPEFIEVAEASGVMATLFAHILDQVLQQQTRWAAELGWVPQVAVNVSAKQLAERDLPCQISRALEAHGRAPEDLWVELTESAFSDEAALASMRQLSELGIRIAVDDFGTGYSSLALLRGLPVDLLKIDRAFTSRLGSPTDDALFAAIINVAHSLKARTVAEGVETAAQLETLQRLGCDVAQGWVMAKAMPGDEAVRKIGVTRRWHGPGAELMTSGMARR